MSRRRLAAGRARAYARCEDSPRAAQRGERVRSLILAVAALLAGAFGAAAATGARDLERLDRFARDTGPFCAQASARLCFERSFRFADRDGDGELSVDELRALKTSVLDWTRANRERLAPADRKGILATLAIVELAGLESLIASYDADGNGRLSRAELLADVRLDDRPLPLLVADPGVVDWPRLRGRLGAAGALLDAVLPQGRR
jgi:hypothetical protein